MSDPVIDNMKAQKAIEEEEAYARKRIQHWELRGDLKKAKNANADLNAILRVKTLLRTANEQLT
jgi:hypothetical protein